MEKDDEITGNSGSHYTTHFRGYDARVGRWLSVDPKADEQPFQSPYCAMDNNPIKNTDIMGDCTTCDFAAGVGEGIVSGAGSWLSGIGNFFRHPDVALNNLGYALDHPAQTWDKINQHMGEQGAILYQTGTPQERGKVVGETVFTAVSIVLGGGATRLTKTSSTVLKTENAGAALTKSERMVENANKGANFETKVIDATKKTQDNVQQQVTIKTNSGTKTKIDIVGKDPTTAKIKLTEAKSSATAPLTKNQAKAFPEIEQSGGTIVGKGKPGYPGGTKIPPTPVDVVRPKDLR